MPRMIVLVLLVVVALGGAFFAGRATGPSRTSSALLPEPASEEDAEAITEDLDENVSLFDRVDEQIEREPGRQVTEETALAGSFEVEIGTSRGRAGAERMRSQAAEAGAPTMIARTDDGSYRVVAGPFSSRRAAQDAARRIQKETGRAPVVRERPR